MKPSKSKWSALFLTLSLVFGVTAFSVSESPGTQGASFRLEVLLRSEILDEGIPFDALLIESQTDHFRDQVEGEVSLARSNTDDPALFKVKIDGETELKCRTALASLKPVLRASLENLALRENSHLLNALSELPEPSGNENISPSTEALQPTLGTEERQIGLRLSQEIDELKAYLNGEPEPAWLMSRLDRGALRQVRDNLDLVEGELERQRAIFKNGSKSVQAQSKLVAAARREFKKKKRQLASALLSKLKKELGELENLTLQRIDANSRLVSKSNATKKNTKVGEAPKWSESLKQDLTKEKARIQALTEIQQVQEPLIMQSVGSHYWLSVGLWIASVCSLLAALFRPTGTERIEPLKARSEQHRRPSTHPSFQRLHPDPEEEPLLLEALAAIQRELGHPPTRILVLGRSPGKARASAAARLAWTVSGAGQKVRLVDFDLKGKALSSSLGNLGTAGVSELLTGEGPVDEFLASVKGTKIEFAPAGNLKFLTCEVDGNKLKQLLSPGGARMLLIDASFDSPLHLVLGYVEAVICVTENGVKWNPQQQEVLLALRDAGLPIWGLLQGGQELYPFT